MRRVGKLLIAGWLLSGAVSAQAPPEELQPVATMKELMLDVIHPASNSLLIAVNRGGPNDDQGWAEARRSAMTLAESGNLLIMRNRAAAWVTQARRLADVGTTAYRAAVAKDARALAALSDRLDASCTACHAQFRPNVFPAAR
jgi:cytochrome c556